MHCSRVCETPRLNPAERDPMKKIKLLLTNVAFGMCFSILPLTLIESQVFAKANASKMIGQPAPDFQLKDQEGNMVKLSDRKAKGYTVLFFYPKAGTPGCTKQACAFRDSVKVIRDAGAEVFGISTDSVSAQKKFHTEHKMTFSLLSDEDGSVTKMFGTKMPIVNMSKRQTFILDKDLIIREHFEDVDPALDAKNVAESIKALGKPK